MADLYIVHARYETGDWIEEPEYMCQVDLAEWLASPAKHRVERTTYAPALSPLAKPWAIQEKRALEIVWVE